MKELNRNGLNEKEAQYRKMTETPVVKLILELSLPTTVSMLVTNLYNMVDTYFVSCISLSASGAVGIVFGLMAIIQAFGFMFGHGSGSNISRLLGQEIPNGQDIFPQTDFIFLLPAACLL